MRCCSWTWQQRRGRGRSTHPPIGSGMAPWWWRTRRATPRSIAPAERPRRRRRRSSAISGGRRASPPGWCAGACSPAGGSGASTGRMPAPVPRATSNSIFPPCLARCLLPSRPAPAPITGCASSSCYSDATRWCRTAWPARAFLDEAIAEGRRYEQRITAALSRIVFDHVFPALATAIAHPSARATCWPPRARRRCGCSIGCCSCSTPRTATCCRSGMRATPHTACAGSAMRPPGSSTSTARSRRARGTWWSRLTELFRAIAAGDPGLGLPPYNGGLFDDRAADLLARITLPDAVLAPLLDAMSREDDAGTRRWINYRDLSVQHLGGIYERLLEQDLVDDGAGGTMLRANPFARKTTGSDYTPDELVRLILRRAIGPLLAERREAFRARVAQLASDRRPKSERLTALARIDPAEAFVGLRVCDPAMGSGHFLVSLVDYLGDEVLTAITEAPIIVTLGGARPSVSLAAGAPHRGVARTYQGGGRRAWLAGARGPARRSPSGAPHHPQARHLWRGHESDGGRARQAVALAALLHRRRPALLPRPSPARRRQPVRRVRQSGRAGSAHTLRSGDERGGGAARDSRRRAWRWWRR